jgi:3',5'-cyclic AMP phosphodiesterase CpdA
MHVSAAFDPSIGHAQGAFAAIGQFDPKPDAVIINGDITDHGQPEEYDLVEQLAAAEGLDFPQDFILIMGNHEQRGYTDEATSEAFAAQRNLFMERCGVGHLYYDLEVNGVHVIALGPDADPQAWWAVRFTDKQLTWLDELLAKDVQRGRLAFVFTHQPINDTVAYTHDGELAYDSLESSDQLHDVVSKYDNVVVVSAHSHSPCDFYQPDASGPLYVADSAVAYLRTDPFVNWSEDGINYSRGLIADVYGNRIEFTSWDFVLNDEADTGGYTLQV